MKKYQVELKYTMYVMYDVEADNEKQAEDKAWEMLDNDADHGAVSRDRDWELNAILEKSETNHATD